MKNIKSFELKGYEIVTAKNDDMDSGFNRISRSKNRSADRN